MTFKHRTQFLNIFKIKINLIFSFSKKGLVKYYAIIVHFPDVKYCIDFMINIYKINEKSLTSLNNETLQKIIKNLTLFYKLWLIIYPCVVTGMIMMPLFVYYLTGEISYILPAQIPGINEHTIIGYSMAAIYHAVMIAIAMIGTFVSDWTVGGSLLNAWGLAQLIRNGFSELNDRLQDNNRGEKKIWNDNAIMWTVRHLIQRHQEFQKYFDRKIAHFFYY